MEKNHLGARVQHLINQSGDSKTVAAAKLNMSRNALYETFKNEDVSTEKLKKIANVYGVDLDYFFTSKACSEGFVNVSKYEQLEKENMLLRHEVETLKEVIKLLNR